MSYALAHSPATISLKNPTVEASIAVSNNSLRILDLINDLNKNNDRSILLGWRSSLRSQISELLAHYNLPGWDGEDALPVSVEAATIANSMIDALPDDVIAPELTPEIDGRISLDWNIGKNRILTLSIGPSNILFAAIVGMRKIHGESNAVYDLPNEVKDLLPGYFSRLS